MSKIEWTEKTWSPMKGCFKVSDGCTNCYAMTMARRLAGIGTTAKKYGGLVRTMANGSPQWTGLTWFDRDVLTEPLARKKPTVYFVNSMSDTFHHSFDESEISDLFTVMSLCDHTFQVLTKRPERMREILTRESSNDQHDFFWDCYLNQSEYSGLNDSRFHTLMKGKAHLKNVWLGTSVESQSTAADRIPHLMATPAAVRFLSMEPLLGPVDLSQIEGAERLDWIIVGGESGPGARPMHPLWVMDVYGFCLDNHIPFFFKQWGRLLPEVAAESAVGGVGNRRLKDVYYRAGSAPMACYDMGKGKAGRLLFGQTHDAMPPLYHTTF